MKTNRYLGLELSGAKNSKTTIAVLEYYPKEEKVFLLDLHSGIGSDESGNADKVLIESLMDHADQHANLKIATSTPLTLPPCFRCSRKKCTEAERCTSPDVDWMRDCQTQALKLRPKKPQRSKKTAIQKDFFTPYTQRPVELWIKNSVLPKLPEKLRFDIDETLGGNKAPLTARMQYLQTQMSTFRFYEVLPKLTVALLVDELKINQRIMKEYRQLEDGVLARQSIVEKMAEDLNIFIYDRDLKTITQNINAFDAFICAYTLTLLDQKECAPAPKGFPVKSGWIQYPNSALLSHEAEV